MPNLTETENFPYTIATRIMRKVTDIQSDEMLKWNYRSDTFCVEKAGLLTPLDEYDNIICT